MILAAREKAAGDKLFYRIGEASRLVGEKAYVLRYWETEFEELCPRKGPGGVRLYRNSDIELIRQIRYLLHEQRFSIEGARRALRQRRQAVEKKDTSQLQMDFTSDKKNQFRGALRDIRRELENLIRILDQV